MVEDVQSCGMDFKGGALLEFEALVNGKVSDVGNRVAYGVASDIAEGGPEDLLGNAGVLDEANVVVVDCHHRPRSVQSIQADQLVVTDGSAIGPEKRVSVAAVDTHTCQRSARTAEERTGGFEVVESSIEDVIVEVAAGIRSLDNLQGSKALSRRQDVVCRNRPAAERVTDQAVLLFEEREFLGESKGPALGEVESGRAVFGIGEIQRVLRKSR